MKKYSITKRLLEDTTPPVFDINSHVEFGDGLLFGDYVPTYTAQRVALDKGDAGQVLATKVEFDRPTGDIKYLKDGKDLYMLSVDFAEVLGAYYKAVTLGEKTKVMGGSFSYDIKTSEGNWEAKALGKRVSSPTSARIGGHGSKLIAPGLGDFQNLFECMREARNWAVKAVGKRALKNMKLGEAVSLVDIVLNDTEHDISGRALSGELPSEVMFQPKENGPRYNRGGYANYSRWVGAMFSLLFKIKKLGCDATLYQKYVGGSRLFDEKGKLKKDQPSQRKMARVIRGVMEFGMTPEEQVEVAECVFIDKINGEHGVFDVSDRLTMINKLGRMVPPLAFATPTRAAQRQATTISARMVKDYAGEVENFKGYVFIFGLGSNTVINPTNKKGVLSADEKITLYFLEKEEAIKSKSGIEMSRSITQRKPKINFFGAEFQVIEESRSNERRLLDILAEDCEAMILGDPISTPHREEIKSKSREGIKSKAKLFRIAQKSQSMHDRLLDDDDLPEWVQDMITTSEDRLRAAYDYIEYKLHRMKTDGVKLTEARKRKLIKDMLKVI